MAKIIIQSTIPDNIMDDISPGVAMFYLAICMKSDVDGLVNAEALRLKFRQKQSALDKLYEYGYLIYLGGGIAVVTHHWWHNAKKMGNKSPSIHTEKMKMLKVDEDDKYCLAKEGEIIEVKKDNDVSKEIADEIISHYNNVTGENIKNITPYKKGLSEYLKAYELEDIKTAITNAHKSKCFKTNSIINVIFRHEFANGTPTDNIQRALSTKPMNVAKIVGVSAESNKIANEKEANRRAKKQEIIARRNEIYAELGHTEEAEKRIEEENLTLEL